MNEKTTGYVLLVLGVGVMIFSAMSLVLVFTKHAEPINLFQISLPPPSAAFKTSTLPGQSPNLTPDVSQMLSQLTSQTGNMFSSSALTQYSNISAHFFLMSFIMAFGFKVATLGVQLLRPVYVKYKVKEDSAPPENPVA